MLKHYFLISLRHLLKNRIYSFINLGGLILGITCSLFIFLWIQDEYQMDHFHTQSLHEALQPVVLDLKEGLDFGTILVKSKPGELESAITSVETLFSEMNPGHAFEYSFLDLETQKQYQSEQLTTRLSNVFGALAIVIACLGLLGLSMFAAERRIKEVGIRKVLGASMSNIVGLLSRDFLLLVIISFVIASPIAWYAMQNWLEAFAYRIDIRWWVFILAGFLLLGLSFITVATQGIKSADVNPVVSMREE